MSITNLKKNPNSEMVIDSMATKLSVSFYDEPPQETIGIYEFQSIAVSRLQVLKKIQFLYDSNKEGSSELMAKEINSYSR